MSYCRFSSDDFRCDLYVYESDHGYVTHVANMRVVGEVPKVPDINDPNFTQALRRQIKFMNTAERVPIELQYDGETFNDPDIDSLIDRLKELRQIGYNFPDYVFEELEAEKRSEIKHITDQRV